MYEVFYVIELKPQWYNLRLRGTHYCVACTNDLEVIKRTIYNYVRKYKVVDRIYRATRETESGGYIPPTSFEKWSKDYGAGKHLKFADMVCGVVGEALRDNRKDTPYHHAKKKVRTIVPPHKVAASTSPPQNEKRVVGKITPCKIKRTTTSGA